LFTENLMIIENAHNQENCFVKIAFALQMVN
ncbi:MAG: hypothetical protein RIR96_1133, partial [Bacteroidota bacterium]